MRIFGRLFKPDVKGMYKRKDIEGLVKTLKHEDEKVKFEAAKFLGILGDERAIDPLVEILRYGDEYKRLDAVYAISQIGKPAVEPLIMLFDDENPAVRELAIRALSHIGDGRAKETFIQAFNDGNENIRKYAVIGLGILRDERAIEPLKELLNDPDLKKEVDDVLNEMLGKKPSRVKLPMKIDMKVVNRELFSIKEDIKSLRMYTENISDDLRELEEIYKNALEKSPVNRCWDDMKIVYRRKLNKSKGSIEKPFNTFDNMWRKFDEVYYIVMDYVDEISSDLGDKELNDIHRIMEGGFDLVKIILENMVEATRMVENIDGTTIRLSKEDEKYIGTHKIIEYKIYGPDKIHRLGREMNKLLEENVRISELVFNAFILVYDILNGYPVAEERRRKIVKEVINAL